MKPNEYPVAIGTDDRYSPSGKAEVKWGMPKELEDLLGHSLGCVDGCHVNWRLSDWYRLCRCGLRRWGFNLQRLSNRCLRRRQLSEWGFGRWSIGWRNLDEW